MEYFLTTAATYKSPGAKALIEAISHFGSWHMLSPRVSSKFSSHRLTVHRNLTLNEIIPLIYTLDGTPADCVRIGTRLWNPESKWVIAGINGGSNLGLEIYTSATVAAAREAAMLGFQSIAISLDIGQGRARWGQVVGKLIPVFNYIFAQSIVENAFWNVNLPQRLDQAEMVICPVDKSPLKSDYEREGKKFRFRGQRHKTSVEGRDVALCAANKITISRINI